MNIRLTPEDILTFYKQYGKLPDTHLFAPEDLKEFFTLLHLENQHPDLSPKSKNAIWKKTQQSLNLPKQPFLSFGNFLKVGFAALVAGTGLFFVSTYINNQEIKENQIAFNKTNTAINSLLSELDTSYIDENIISLESTTEKDPSKNSDNSTRIPSFFENLIHKGENTSPETSEFALNTSSTYFHPSDSQNNHDNSNNLHSSQNTNIDPPSEIAVEPSEAVRANPTTNNNHSSETQISGSNTSMNNSGDIFSPSPNPSQSKELSINTKENTEDISENSSTALSDSSNSNSIDPSAGIARQASPQTSDNTGKTLQPSNALDSLSQISQLKLEITEDTILEEIQNNLVYLNNLTF